MSSRKIEFFDGFSSETTPSSSIVTAKSFYVGDTVPSSELGIDGDSYLDSSNGNLYLKDSSVWSIDSVLTIPASGVINTPSGNISATDVQSAINELATEKLDKAGGTITGDLTVDGDLIINGTATTINTESLDVEDSNITINKNGDQTTANANKSGMTIELSDATDSILGYDSSTASKFKAGEVGSESEIVTAEHPQTITNKTIQGASIQGPSKLDPKNDTEANLITYAASADNGELLYATDTKVNYRVIDGAIEKLGAGGQGGINYLGESGNADNGLSDWTDSVTINTTSPLDGEQDFRISLGADSSGVMAQVTFDIPKIASQSGEPLYLTASLDLTGADTSDFDIFAEVLLVGETEPLISTSISTATLYNFITSFTPEYNGVSYILRFNRKYIGTGTAPTSFPSVGFNAQNLIIAPREITKSVGKTSWTLQFDDSLDLNEFLNEGSVGISVTKPAGGRYKLYYNKSRFPNGAIFDFIVKGSSDIDTPHISLGVVSSDAGGDYIQFYIVNSSGQATYSVASGRYLQVTFTQKEEDQTAYIISTNLGNRLIHFEGNDIDESAGVYPANTPFKWLSAVDTVGFYNQTTGQWTIPVNGVYSFNGHIRTTASVGRTFNLYVNGVKKEVIGTDTSPSWDLSKESFFKMGDIVDIRCDQGFDVYDVDPEQWNYISLSKIGNDTPLLYSTSKAFAQFQNTTFTLATGVTDVSFTGTQGPSSGISLAAPTSDEIVFTKKGAYKATISFRGGDQWSKFGFKGSNSGDIIGESAFTGGSSSTTHSFILEVNDLSQSYNLFSSRSGATAVIAPVPPAGNIGHSNIAFTCLIEEL